MLGRFLNLNKMKTKRLSNHMSQNSIHNRTQREHNKCLNWEMLHFYPLNELITKLMPAYMSQKSWSDKGLKKQVILKIFSWENI